MATLQSHPICEQATVVETKVFSSDQFFLKVRANLTGENMLQARIYYNQGHIAGLPNMHPWEIDVKGQNLHPVEYEVN